jgi:hypothetical protein
MLKGRRAYESKKAGSTETIRSERRGGVTRRSQYEDLT